MKKKNYNKKKISATTMSLWFFILIIIITLGLYVYNIKLISSNTSLNESISIKEQSINSLKKNPNIIASSLYNTNKKSIDKLEDYSRISIYINHIIKLRSIYSIDFRWFKYSWGKLSTTVVSSSDSVWINYKKVVRFIKEYRENKDLVALFDLELVKNIVSKNNWVDNEFNINLTLKNNISKILEEQEIKRLEIEKEKEIERLKIIEEEKIKKQKMADKIKSIKEKNDSNSGSIAQ